MGAKHASEMRINTLKKTPICFHLKNKFIRRTKLAQALFYK
jgi:hypothetical protein